MPPPPGGWGEGAWYPEWPSYGRTASREWAGAPVMACDPAVLVATPAACGTLADALLRRLSEKTWEPLDWMCASLAQTRGDVLAGDAYLALPARRGGYASARTAASVASGATVGRRVFDD